jgi:Fe-S cluster assembly protein SufD
LADQAWPNWRIDEFWRNTRFDKKVDVSLPLGEATTTGTFSADGVTVMSLAQAAAHERFGAIVRERLGSLTTTNIDGTGAAEDRTITVSDAAWTDGLFVHVDVEVETDAPISINQPVQIGANQPRILVVMERHSKATIVLEHDAKPGAPTLVNEVLEAILLDGSSLNLVSMQEWSDDVTHLSLQKAAVHRDASFRYMGVMFGGGVVRIRPEADLVGAGGYANVNGIYVTDEGQHFDLQPYMRHLAPKATSDVLYKGALQGKSTAIFRGNVFVHKDAPGTDTNENSRTLILTPGARAESTPFLEIECADITAGHGSATGQIDAASLFYLQSRAISRLDALRLIVLGFFHEVLARVELPESVMLEERVTAHLENEVANTDLNALAVSAAAPQRGDE